MKKRFLCFGLIFLMLFSFAACAEKPQAGDQNSGNNQAQEPPQNSQTEEGTKPERPLYTVDMEFIDNQVVVTLTEKASFERIFDDYTTEDFSEVGAIAVSEITAFTIETIRQCLLADPTGGTIPYHLSGFEKFRQFEITLAEESKENVLRAIDVLYERDDIKAAGPNFILYLD